MRAGIVTGMIAFALAGSGACRAGDLNIRILLSGEIAPGVYGQVQLGNEAPPPLVYAQPMLMERAPPGEPLPPVYLHVPPGHAKNWRKHCREYNACNRRVYFIRSAEYEPDYGRRDHGHDRDAEHGHGHDKDQDHDHDRDRHRDD